MYGTARLSVTKYSRTVAAGLGSQAVTVHTAAAAAALTAQTNSLLGDPNTTTLINGQRFLPYIYGADTLWLAETLIATHDHFRDHSCQEALRNFRKIPGLSTYLLKVAGAVHNNNIMFSHTLNQINDVNKNYPAAMVQSAEALSLILAPSLLDKLPSGISVSPFHPSSPLPGASMVHFPKAVMEVSKGNAPNLHGLQSSIERPETPMQQLELHRLIQTVLPLENAHTWLDFNNDSFTLPEKQSLIKHYEGPISEGQMVVRVTHRENGTEEIMEQLEDLGVAPLLAEPDWDVVVEQHRTQRLPKGTVVKLEMDSHSFIPILKGIAEKLNINYEALVSHVLDKWIDPAYLSNFFDSAYPSLSHDLGGIVLGLSDSKNPVVAMGIMRYLLGKLPEGRGSYIQPNRGPQTQSHAERADSDGLLVNPMDGKMAWLFMLITMTASNSHTKLDLKQIEAIKNTFNNRARSAVTEGENPRVRRIPEMAAKSVHSLTESNVTQQKIKDFLNGKAQYNPKWEGAISKTLQSQLSSFPGALTAPFFNELQKAMTRFSKLSTEKQTELKDNYFINFPAQRFRVCTSALPDLMEEMNAPLLRDPYSQNDDSEALFYHIPVDSNVPTKDSDGLPKDTYRLSP